MKSFKTIQGFFSGTSDSDLDKELAHYAMLRIWSDRLDFEAIGAALNLAPTSMRRRGQPQTPGSAILSKDDAWMFKPPVPEERELAEHVDALWSLLEPHVDFLKSLKSQADVDVCLGYWSSIDHGGLVIPHQSLEMFTALEVDVQLFITTTLPDEPV